jgi:hypothetical protein
MKVPGAGSIFSKAPVGLRFVGKAVRTADIGPGLRANGAIIFLTEAMTDPFLMPLYCWARLTMQTLHIELECMPHLGQQMGAMMVEAYLRVWLEASAAEVQMEE